MLEIDVEDIGRTMVTEPIEEDEYNILKPYWDTDIDLMEEHHIRIRTSNIIEQKLNIYYGQRPFVRRMLGACKKIPLHQLYNDLLKLKNPSESDEQKLKELDKLIEDTYDS